jgi:acetyl esterase/lipase
MRLHLLCLASLAGTLIVGCDRQPTAHSLTEARQGFATKLIRQQNIGMPVAEPPPNLFSTVKYQSPLGDMPAYVSVPPSDAQRHPAIIWIVGGFDNSIGEGSWLVAPPSNDQSASAFWKAGVITMYPSLRGGNQNPGYTEGFYGEVDDVLAAADFLAKQDYVDPKRIYLGGHSTGGTLALLVAETSDRFRAVFAFGPVGNIARYGQDNLPFKISDRQETDLRSPAKWLDSIRNPTFVFEGTEKPSNIVELKSMSHQARNPLIQFHPVNGANHFGTLAPVSALIAQKILHDDADSPSITFSDAELQACMSGQTRF